MIFEAKGTASAINSQIKNISVVDGPTEGLAADLEQAKKDTEAALVNSFDTPAVMRAIGEVIRKANVHVGEHKSDADLKSLEAIARWTTKIIGILGLDANATAPYDGLGWVSAAAAANLEPTAAVAPYKAVYETVKKDVQALDLPGSDGITSLLAQNPDAESESFVNAGNKDPEQLAYPYLLGVSKLRDELRRIAPTAAADTKKSILALSDRIRDFDLTNLGVYLDDRPDEPSLIKFIPTSELIAAREEKAAQAAAKAQAKEEARLARERAEAERLEKAKVKPEEMYKTGEAAEKYSEWDGEGMPTKLKDGNEVPKSQLKKLKKDHDKQKKAYGEWLTKFGGAAS